MLKFLAIVVLMIVLAYAVFEMFLMVLLGEGHLALAFFAISLLALYGALRVAE